jgi:hypothetical protein
VTLTTLSLPLARWGIPSAPRFRWDRAAPVRREVPGGRSASPLAARAEEVLLLTAACVFILLDAFDLWAPVRVYVEWADGIRPARSPNP